MTLSEAKDMCRHGGYDYENKQPTLTGYRMEGGDICWKCVSCAFNRGFGPYFRGVPIIFDEPTACSICHKTAQPDGSIR